VDFLFSYIQMLNRICTRYNSIYLYLVQHYLFVPGTTLSICTWYNTIYLYLVQHYLFEPGTTLSICTWYSTIYLHLPPDPTSSLHAKKQPFQKRAAFLTTNHKLCNSLSYFNPAILNRCHNGLCTIIHIHLLKNITHVVLNGFFTDIQCFTNASVTFTVSKHLKNFAFAASQ
jgi:hypothetical protein